MLSSFFSCAEDLHFEQRVNLDLPDAAPAGFLHIANDDVHNVVGCHDALIDTSQFNGYPDPCPALSLIRVKRLIDPEACHNL